jgi:hypothetical protein
MRSWFKHGWPKAVGTWNRLSFVVSSCVVIF